MPPTKNSITNRSATTKAGPAAAERVAPRIALTGRTLLDEVAELLLVALNSAAPTKALFVYRVIKPGNVLHGEKTGVEAATRSQADAIASDRAKRWGCELRFVRQQRAVALASKGKAKS